MEILDQKYYDRLTDQVRNVRINNLFVRSVIERKVSGKVYVDNADQPQTFYIIHSYGMSLLGGNTNNTEFNQAFLNYSLNTDKTRTKPEWMQVFPDDWNKVLAELYGECLIKSIDNVTNRESGIIELNTRVNFAFNKKKYLQNNNPVLPQACQIIRTNRKYFEEMSGLVIPSHFWDSADDFLNHGVGFSLIYNNKLAATAYSAYKHDDKLELGIETIPEFRGMGFARLVCAALIDYCIEHNYEPVWSCRFENTASFCLAQKLGFEVVLKLPYYKLGL